MDTFFKIILFVMVAGGPAAAVHFWHEKNTTDELITQSDGYTAIIEDAYKERDELRAQARRATRDLEAEREDLQASNQIIADWSNGSAPVPIAKRVRNAAIANGAGKDRERSD